MSSSRSNMPPPTYDQGGNSSVSPASEPGARGFDTGSVMSFDGSDTSTIRPRRDSNQQLFSSPTNPAGGGMAYVVNDAPDAGQATTGPTYYGMPANHGNRSSAGPSQQTSANAEAGTSSPRRYVHPAHATAHVAPGPPLNLARPFNPPHPFFFAGESPFQGLVSAGSMASYGSGGGDSQQDQGEGMRRTMFPNWFGVGSSSGSSSAGRASKRRADAGSSSRSAGASGSTTPALMRPQFAADPNDPNYIPIVIHRSIFGHYFNTAFWLWVLGPHFNGTEAQLRDLVWALMRVLNEFIGVPVPAPAT